MSGAHTERAHSDLGASSASRWMNCPGSLRLGRGSAKRTSGFAAEGTMMHEVGEKCLLAALAGRNRRDAADYVGETFVIDGRTMEFGEDHAEAVQVYVDAVLAGYEAASKDHTLMIEQRFTLDRLYPGMFGTCDAVLYDRRNKKMTVFDLKGGRGVAVEAVGNPQLRYYGLGALLANPQWKVDVVELVIVQPRASHRDGPVRRWAIDAVDLMEFAADLVAAAKRTEDPSAPLKAGPWCKFCPALATCPTQRAEALSAARAVLVDDEVKLPERPDDLPIDVVATILDNADRIEAWLREVKAWSHARLEAGRDVPGWKLVAKRAARKWADGVDEYAVVRTLGMGGPEMVTERKLLSPAKVEKLLPKDQRGALDALCVKESTGTTLAPVSDKRSAVSPSGLSSNFFDD